MNVEAALKTAYPANIVDELLKSYREIEQNYSLGKWKASELDAGHFVEGARRLLEHALFGAATPIGTDMSKFNTGALGKYENASGDESLRLLIPRVLWSIYGIRNKRGVGHPGLVSPNKMDSALILANVKWVLAEFVRLTSGISVSDAQAAVDAITERQLDLLWKHGDITRVQDPKIVTRDQVLLLLYDKSPQQSDDLQRAVEYANSTNFKKILKRLHKDRLIEFADSGTCIITSRGVITAEKLARNKSLLN
jgi:hypothetical protein